jgi:hypothetical protein
MARFKDLPGANKVQKREYALEDSSTKMPLSRDRAFSPFGHSGSRLEMSMVFKEQKRISISCPGCDTISSQSNRGFIKW